LTDRPRTPSAFDGLSVTVVGLARSGAAAANMLAEFGADVTVTDSKPADELAAYTGMLANGVKTVLGSHPEGLFTGVDLVVVSPGVPLAIEPIRKARAAGVRVIGELELAYECSDSKFAAITGSNGKSTTTTLVGLMLERSGKDVLVGGNIGNALTAEPAALIGRDWVVAEVSSFQLEAIENFRPRVAAILNITPDHMDRYDSMQSYAAAKAGVFMNQTATDTLVYNADDGLTAEMVERAASIKIPFSALGPLEPGVYVRDGIMFDGTRTGAHKEIMPVSEVMIRGAHNLENALAAAAVSLAAGAKTDAVADTLREFRGLEHRLEHVADINGAAYYNDSKGTNVGAVIKSLESFDSPVILIAGGLDKHGDFGALAGLVKDRVKKLVLIGDAADKIREALGDCSDTVKASGMEDAVNIAHGSAEPGDVVLLSPACASFDMFDNFEHRGKVFKEAVRRLPGSN